MKSFLKWTVTIAAFGIGSAMAWRAVQAGRERLRNALDRAEGVANQTQKALEQTEAALHEMKTSV
jgi:hypothetical protein